MSKKRYYDTKLKVQLKPKGDLSYRPSYPRFIVFAKDATEAKEAAKKVVVNAWEKEFAPNDYTISVSKCNYVKIDGVIHADKYLDPNNTIKNEQ